MDFQRLLATAKLHLIQREYKSVLSTCLYALELLQNTTQDAENHQVKVAFGLLAIQGLALDCQWKEVHSFVEEWFGEVGTLPSEILLLCTCVYLHINDYQSALNMTEEWLEHEQNQCQHGIVHVVEFYIRNILLPKRQTKKAKDFLKDCTNITEQRKQSLLLYVERSQQTSSSDEVYIDQASPSTSQTDIQEKGKSFSLLLRVIKLCATTKQVLNNMSIKTTVKGGARLVILLYFLYIIIARTDLPGDIFNKGSGPVLLWNAVKRAWRALFAPYHLLPK